MDLYYIVITHGLLKQYYSEQVSSSSESPNNPINFSASLRNAKAFASIEAARAIISEKQIEHCMVVNQNGQQQL